jgi:hypothetical protein
MAEYAIYCREAGETTGKNTNDGGIRVPDKHVLRILSEPD